MKKILGLACGAIVGASLLCSVCASPIVSLRTSIGVIEVELDSAKAPKTVMNFVSYVKSGFYDGTVFHRVIPGFMIQGGGMTADLAEKPTGAPIENEAFNMLKNARGTISMARRGDPNSATAQFFINTVDNAPLNFTERSGQGFGYCVFGKVVKGMDVVDKIAAVSTTNMGMYQNVPVTPVVVQKASMVVAAPAAKGK